MHKLVAFLILVAVFVVGCGESERSNNVPLADVPENVMKVAKEKLPDVAFDQAWKTRTGNYEVRGKTKSGKTRDIQITPSGEVVEID